MTPYQLHREQLIPQPVEEVFAFFAQAENLDRLTPAWLHFRILTPQPILMQEGTVIRYCIRWGWVPLTWSTEITRWKPPLEFVDVQRKGPYKFWEHTWHADDGHGALCVATWTSRTLGALVHGAEGFANAV
jgi:ligand-binding SRPBCC domain-containing protein